MKQLQLSLHGHGSHMTVVLALALALIHRAGEARYDMMAAEAEL
jgi:hypothetical protein